MSINFHIGATREIVVVKTDKKSIQEISFGTWQTPSEVTHRIMKTVDPIASYKEWVLSVSSDERIPVYADEDIFGEGEPIAFELVNSGKEHVEVLNQWIADAIEDGYELVPECW